MYFDEVKDLAENNLSNVLQYRRDPEILFNIGLKYASKRDFNRALRFMDEAIKCEPFNAEYLFNLACVQAELRQSKASNNSLIYIIVNIDPTMTECYFGVACNYFDIGDLKKAREYLEKYVSAGDEGEFEDVANDILYYLQIFEDNEQQTKSNKRVSRFLTRGKQLIKEAYYAQACSKLEKAVEIDPFQVAVRNYLALACFLNNDIDRAMSIAKSVLKLENDNVFAHCNLALFYAHKNMMNECNDQIEVLNKSKINNREEFVQYLKKALTRVKVKDIVIQKIAKALNIEIYNKIDKTNVEERCRKQIKWKREWKEIIECALNNREFSYESDYENKLREIWVSYISNVNPDSLPIIRKREAWAAALEYVYCCNKKIKVTKRRLADKYNISTSSLANKLKVLK